MAEDEFTPALGRIRSRGKGKARTYLGRVVAAAARSGTTNRTIRRTFDGSRIGRGAGVGRILRGGDRHAAARRRRVVVKARLVKFGAKGLSGANAHLRYLQRDGVTRTGDPGTLYSAEQDAADGKTFLARQSGDRHQFRFIVSAEDGADYPDLKPFVRRLMHQVEADLGTRLDWVAVDHFNTGHPHTHILLRGIDDQGRDLIIAREYIAHGLRERAGDIVSLDLGPRTDLEIEMRLRQDITAERLTGIDRRLIRDAGSDLVVAAGDPDPFQQALRAGRLQKLGNLGLADHQDGDRWRLADDLEDMLRRLGERGDIIRAMHRDLGATIGHRSGIEARIFDATDPASETIVGRVIRRGFSDEHRDRHYLLVDGIDGRTHYVDVGRADRLEPTPEGAVVRILARESHVREVDRTIDAIARAHNGRYSVDLHLRHDPNASQAYAESHVRRLEAMRRLSAGVERASDGSWTVSEDHLDRVAAFEQRISRDRPVSVEIQSTIPLEAMGQAEAATWLDRTLVGGETGLAIRDAGFGQALRAAQAQRTQWLVAQDLAIEEEGAIRFRANLLATLQRRELLRVAGPLSDELGIDFVEAAPGTRVEGILRRRLDLISGRFAVVDQGRDFTLLPWRPTLEQHLGKPVSGLVRESGISWQIGRDRGGPSITG